MSKVYPILFFAALLALCAPSSAQSFTIQNARPSGAGSPFATFESKTRVRNSNGNTTSVQWSRIETNVPYQWDIAVCEDQCYTGYTHIFKLAPRQEKEVRISVNPHGIYGSGNVKLVFFNPQDSAGTANVVDFDLTSSANNNAVNRQSLKIFPNPVTEFIQFEGSDDVQRVEIYDMLGNPVARYQVSYGGEKYYVNTLARGLYLVRLIDSRNNIIFTQRISKYNP